jgi:hypothetical protein
MSDLEAVVPREGPEARPHEELLVESHLTDVVPPEIYFGEGVDFVAYVQSRANVRSPSSCSLEHAVQVSRFHRDVVRAVLQCERAFLLNHSATAVLTSRRSV